MNSVGSEIVGSANPNNKYSNLTKEEWEALEKLNRFQKDGIIVIQPEDKNEVFAYSTEKII